MGNGTISGLVSRDASNSAMVDQFLDISSLLVYLFERVACIRQFVRGSTIFWLIFVSSQRRFLHKKTSDEEPALIFRKRGPGELVHGQISMLKERCSAMVPGLGLTLCDSTPADAKENSRSSCSLLSRAHRVVG